MFSKKNLTTEERFRRFVIQFVAIFAGTVLVMTILLSTIILDKSSDVMRRNVSSLISTNSRQLELNINAYMRKVEATTTLLFANEEFYLYDETDASIEDYDKRKIESDIGNRIVDLGLMENFSDFTIVYKDDYSVGWKSKVTQSLFAEDSMYEFFSDYTTKNETQDSWLFGVKDNVDRIFYVKRLNPNAILVTSFYNRELKSVFEYPEQLKDLTVRLVDSNDNIVFSSNQDEIGVPLADDINGIIQQENLVGGFIMNDQYLINVGKCENEWRVICSIPTEVLMKENNDLRRSTNIIAATVVVLFVLIGYLGIWRLSRTVDGMVVNLEEKASHDLLSGVLNKASFEEQVSHMLEDCQGQECKKVFFMLDMDNFKSINDTLGHAYGDEVIIRMGKLLSGFFESVVLVGRLGGDEFAVSRTFRNMDMKRVEECVAVYMDMLLNAFREEFAKEYETCKASLSVGVCIMEEDEVSFEELYHKADAALYNAKKSGKNQYVIYQEGMTSDK